MALSRDQKKGRHELRRKRNQKRMRLHRWTTEGKIGPNDNTDGPLSHGGAKLTKAAKKAAELAEAKTDALPSEATQASEVAHTEAV